MTRGLAVLTLLVAALAAMATAAHAQTPCGGILQPACPTPTPPPVVTPAPTASPTPEPEPDPEPAGPTAKQLDNRARTAVRKIHKAPTGADRRVQRQIRDERNELSVFQKRIRLHAAAARTYARAASRVGALEAGSKPVRSGLTALRRYYRIGAQFYATIAAAIRANLAGDRDRGQTLLRRAIRAIKPAGPLRKQAQRQLRLKLP